MYYHKLKFIIISLSAIFNFKESVISCVVTTNFNLSLIEYSAISNKLYAYINKIMSVEGCLIKLLGNC